MKMIKTFFHVYWLCVGGYSVNADVVEYFNAPPIADDPAVELSHIFLSTSRQAHIKALLTTVHFPVGFMHVVTSSSQGCFDSKPVSEIASNNGCLYAINAGPFNMDTGACAGNVVSNGTIIQTDESGFANWGLTRDGRWVFGQFGAQIIEDSNVVELISGFKGALLVDDFSGVPSSSTLVAQRQAVGIDEQGKLLFLTIDGSESPPRGMNLTEFGAAFASLGARIALNLDGGGSTATWFNGSLADRPTCKDTPFPECERSVASAVCVMPGAAHNFI